MPQSLTAGLPPGLELPSGYVVRLSAVSPSTGNPVGGVVITNAVLYVRNLGSGETPELAAGDWMLVPGSG